MRLLLLSFFSLMVQHVQGQMLHPVLQLSLPEYDQTTNAIVVGEDASTFYAITTGRFFMDPDDPEEQMPDNTAIHIKGQLEKGKTIGIKSGVSVIFCNRKSNIAIVAIERNKLPKGIVVKGYKRSLLNWDIDHISMPLSVAHYTSEKLNSSSSYLQGVRYYDDERALRIGATNIQEEAFGGAVTNSNGDLVGMVQQLNSRRAAARVLKLSMLLKYLEVWNIPSNLLRTNDFVGAWSIRTLDVGEQDHQKFAFNSNKLLYINPEGKLARLCPGKIANVGSKIHFYCGDSNYNIMMDPEHDGVSAYVLPRTVLENGKIYSYSFVNDSTLVFTSNNESITFHKHTSNFSTEDFTRKPKSAAKSWQNVVKIYLPDQEINGTGILTGHDDNALYVVTAAHTFASPNDPNKLLSDTEIEVLLYPGTDIGAIGPSQNSRGKVIHFDAETDLAILSIERSSIDGKIALPSYSLAVNSSHTRQVGSMTKLRGFSRGSLKQSDQLDLEYILSENETNFQLESEAVEGGFSGCPLFNALNEWMGIALHILPSGKTIRILSAEYICFVLKEKGIPSNCIAKSKMVNSWMPLWHYKTPQEMCTFPPCKINKVQFLQDGSLAGAITG